jgi:hypothetical protein
MKARIGLGTIIACLQLLMLLLRMLVLSFESILSCFLRHILGLVDVVGSICGTGIAHRLGEVLLCDQIVLDWYLACVIFCVSLWLLMENILLCMQMLERQTSMRQRLPIRFLLLSTSMLDRQLCHLFVKSHPSVSCTDILNLLLTPVRPVWPQKKKNVLLHKLTHEFVHRGQLVD